MKSLARPKIRRALGRPNPSSRLHSTLLRSSHRIAPSFSQRRSFGLGKHDGGIFGHVDVNPENRQFNPNNPGVYEWRTHTFEGIDGRFRFREQVRAAPMYYHRYYSQFYPRPLTETLEGVPAQATSLSSMNSPKESLTSRKTKVVTMDTKSPVTSFGIFIQAGSRYESTKNFGSSFLLKNLAFKSTILRPSLRFLREMEMHGMKFEVSSSREFMFYSLTNANPGLNKLALELLLDATRPLLSISEVSDEIHHLTHDMDLSVNIEDYVVEQLHATAYRNIGLGNSIFPTANCLKKLNSDTLRKFMAPLYQAPRMTVTAVGGIDHSQVVEELEFFKNSHYFDNEVMSYVYEKALKDVPQLPYGMPSKEQVMEEIAAEPKKASSVYHGGEFRQPNTGHTFFGLGFQGVPRGDKDHAAAIVLQNILGGGLHSSKGKQVPSHLTSRLNTSVVGTSHALSAQTMNLSYSDSGLFAMTFELHGAHKKSVEKICEETRKVDKVDEKEVSKGKQQAKMEFARSVDSSSGMLEFMALNSSSPSQFFSAIDNVTTQDVQRVAKKIFSSNPTVVSIGNVEEIPTQEQIAVLLK